MDQKTLSLVDLIEIPAKTVSENCLSVFLPSCFVHSLPCDCVPVCILLFLLFYKFPSHATVGVFFFFSFYCAFA